MEHKALGKPSTVSRLPKFGSRLVNAPCSLPNSTVHSLSTHEAKNISGKFNGALRPSSFSIKYGSSTMPLNQEVSGEKRENHVFHPPGSRANKTSNTPPKTGHRTASAGSPKPATERLKSSSKPNTSTISPCSSACKLSQNGTADSIGNGRSPKLQRLRDHSSSSGSLPQSGIGMPSSDRMVRSQSFSHFRQRLPAASAIPRSFSFNKAVELAKPLPNTQLCPVRTLGLKPPQCIPSSRLGMGFEKRFTNHLSTVAPLSECSTPPSGSKKPSLSSSVLSKPSSLGYRLSHTSRAEPQSPLVGRRSPGITLPGSSQNQAQQFGKSSLVDVPDGSEEMSVSSASSDRNDTCEDLLDEFDHVGDQSHNGGAVSVCSESVGGSSLELSPSSSGGTYMWDEDIMEPLGHDIHSHHCNYKSVLTRTDGEKNQEVFDLENDIILTADLPENGALHCGKMFYCESSKTEEPQQRNSRANLLQNWLLVLQGFNGTPAIQSDDHMVALEECAVEQMLLDCSSVKSQLLQLQLLLQMEDSGINSKEWCEVNSAPCQMKTLLKEVTSLREDLKNKDIIISQLHHHNQQHHQQKHHQQLQQQHQQQHQQLQQQQLQQQQDQKQLQQHQQQQTHHHQQQQQQLQDRSLLGSGVKLMKGQKAHKCTQTSWRPPHTLQKLHPSSPRTSRAQTQEPSAGSGSFNKFSHYRGPQ